MPYTKRKAHYKTADDLIDYIMNEDKTDGGLLITGLNCNADLAKQEFKNTAQEYQNKGKRVAYHLMQSFSPNDNISPEQAHEIGVKLCKELYPNFQCVVTTHIDRGHLHNHIAINAVNLEGRKLNDKRSDKKEGLYAFQEKSDEIATEYGCYVMPKFKFDNKKKKQSDMYFVYKHQTWKETVLTDMTNLKLQCSSMNEFIVKLFDLGYDVKYGKYISVKPQGKERFVRLKTLSEEFSEENLRLYFSGRQPQYKIQNKKYETNSFNVRYVEYYRELNTALELTSSVAIKGGQYPKFQVARKKAEIRSEQIQSTLDMLKREKINSFDDLEKRINGCRADIHNANKEIFMLEKANENVLEQISKAQDFIHLKKTYDYAQYYKSIDAEYKMPDEVALFEQLKSELNISTVSEAKEIIKSSGQIRKDINIKKSAVYDLQQILYQFELLKENQLLSSDLFIHNIKVGNNRIDYKNSTKDEWCIQLPYCDYCVFIDKRLSTFNHKYGYNTLFLIADKGYTLYKKTENNELQRAETINGDQLDRFVAEMKKENIEQHKNKNEEKR